MIDRFDGTKYKFLSNFHMFPIVYEGIKYPSTEHAYQAAKTVNPKLKQLIAQYKTPAEAKKAGQQVAMRPDWNDVRLQIMEDVLLLKFADAKLRDKLLATEDEELVEGNTWGDKYWGQVDGVGENHLGKLLMKLRSEYRSLIDAARGDDLSGILGRGALGEY